MRIAGNARRAHCFPSGTASAILRRMERTAMNLDQPLSAAASAAPLDTLPHPVAGHADSLLPKGRSFRLAWADEFDGTELDETKWAYRLSMMQKLRIWAASTSVSGVGWRHDSTAAHGAPCGRG